MKVQCGVEGAVIVDRSKPLSRANVLRQFSAEEISEGAAGQPRKEIARDDAEPIRRTKLGERLLNIGRRRLKQAW